MTRDSLASVPPKVPPELPGSVSGELGLMLGLPAGELTPAPVAWSLR